MAGPTTVARCSGSPLAAPLPRSTGFCSESDYTDGRFPSTGLIQSDNGNLFGTTNSGTIFKVTPSGTLTTLYTLCTQAGCPKLPIGLTQGTNGIFYGSTFDGGAGAANCPFVLGCGTIFSLSTGQTPFIETRPASAAVGKAVTILGYKLTGAPSVTFNGTPAAFTIKSPTEITTTVPAGATTGKVEVITPGGTLSSNVAFRIP